MYVLYILYIIIMRLSNILENQTHVSIIIIILYTEVSWNFHQGRTYYLHQKLHISLEIMENFQSLSY